MKTLLFTAFVLLAASTCEVSVVGPNTGVGMSGGRFWLYQRHDHVDGPITVRCERSTAAWKWWFCNDDLPRGFDWYVCPAWVALLVAGVPVLASRRERR